MFTSSRRRIDHEILDEQTPEAGAAACATWCASIAISEAMRRFEARLRRVAPEGPFTVLDVGAASGDSGAVMRESFPQATVISLDYKTHHLLRAAQPKLAADAFRLPFRSNSFDMVTCSLFLHHFTDDQIVVLLNEFAGVARRAVIINDLERHRLAYYFLPATRWLFGWDRITLHDGPISVQAGFTERELRALAQRAGFRNINTRVHRPAFRITVVGSR